MGRLRGWPPAIALLESEGYRAGPLRIHDGPAAVGADPRRRRCPTASRSGRSSRPTIAGSGTRTARRSAITGRRPTRTEEDFERWFTMPNLDTSLWRVAWDGDEVVGSVMTFIWPEENERLGAQPWLARAHLGSAAVAQAGCRDGADRRFAPDASRDGDGRGARSASTPKNPTGALQLYESLGFRRHRTGIAFRKASSGVEPGPGGAARHRSGTIGPVAAIAGPRARSGMPMPAPSAAPAAPDARAVALAARGGARRRVRSAPSSPAKRRRPVRGAGSRRAARSCPRRTSGTGGSTRCRSGPTRRRS